MTLKSYLKEFQKEKKAIGQFNFSTLEQLRGITMAAVNLRMPVILGTSEGEAGFFGMEEAVAIVNAMRKKYKADIFLNLDHGGDEKLVKKAIDLGYSAVHFDGSKLELKENIKITKRLVDYAHKRGVVIEGELGHIYGESSIHSDALNVASSQLTNPEEVTLFVKSTKVDSLAIAIGTTHGVYQNEQKLDISRLKEIANNTKAFLVLHGGSGVSGDQIKEAIKSGIVKININTEIREAWKNGWQKAIENNKEEYKPYKILPEIIKEVSEKVEEKIKLFSRL